MSYATVLRVQIYSNYSRIVTISLVMLLVLFADIFHQPLDIISDLTSATLSRPYDSLCYFVFTSVDMLDGISSPLRAPTGYSPSVQLLQAPTAHLYSRDQLVSLRDWHRLSTQLCDRTSTSCSHSHVMEGQFGVNEVDELVAASSCKLQPCHVVVVCHHVT